MINRKNGMACYQQLSQILIEQIEKGIFKPGSQLATEIELSKRYRLNRHTVRQAIERLEDEGLVYKVKGKEHLLPATKSTIRYQNEQASQAPSSMWDSIPMQGSSIPMRLQQAGNSQRGSIYNPQIG